MRLIMFQIHLNSWVMLWKRFCAILFITESFNGGEIREIQFNAMGWQKMHSNLIYISTTIKKTSSSRNRRKTDSVLRREMCCLCVFDIFNVIRNSRYLTVLHQHTKCPTKNKYQHNKTQKKDEVESLLQCVWRFWSFSAQIF